MEFTRGILFFALTALLFAAPVSAKENAKEGCSAHAGHNVAMEQPPEMLHQPAADAPSVEEIPAVSSAADANVPGHRHGLAKQSKCDSLKMAHCDIVAGCCIKGDGPLSGGLTVKTIGQEEHFSPSAALSMENGGRQSRFESFNAKTIQRNSAPIPRPPSA